MINNNNSSILNDANQPSNKVIDNPTPPTPNDINNFVNIGLLFPELPNGLPQNSTYSPTTNQKTIDCLYKKFKQPTQLARCAYLQTTKIINLYSKLITIVKEEEKANLVLLRTQNQILLGAILRIYQYTNISLSVPIGCHTKIILNKNNRINYDYLYDQTLVLLEMILLLKTFYSNSALKNQIEIIENNLKSQLFDLNATFVQN